MVTATAAGPPPAGPGRNNLNDFKFKLKVPLELTPWCGGRDDGAEGAISTKQITVTCLY